jgi:succinate dehydrogenase / fumarate reductase membrane anchor subunit
MSQSTSAPRQASLRSPLGRARGAGSAKSGARQWWAQRVSSMALLPLTVWFILSLASDAGMTHAEAQAWIGRPLNAVLLIALVILTFQHAAAGLAEIIEDYLKTEWLRLAALLAVKGLAWLLGIAGVFAVLRIAV